MNQQMDWPTKDSSVQQGIYSPAMTQVLALFAFLVLSYIISNSIIDCYSPVTWTFMICEA